MPGALIGALRVSLSLETAAFEKGATLLQRRAVVLRKQMAAMGDKVAGIGQKMSLGITAPFAALVTAAVPAAIESREALAQVEAALKSMGPVAGKTSVELQKAAKSLETLSTFDDDDILKKVTANLLTFGNVAGREFDRAQQAAVNMSARLGQDLQSSAIQVGKALNDPIKGMTALSRVGVQFSADQKLAIKAMVETGNIAGAQGIILGELERQFGGAAKAARDASPTAAMQQQWRTFQETIGELALKVLPPLINILQSVLGWFNKLSPETQTWVVAIVALSAALGPVLIALGSLMTVISAMPAVLVALTGAWTALKVAFLAVRIAALATLPALSAFLIPLGAIAVAIGAVYLAWKNWDKITAIVSRLYNGVKTYLQDKLNSVFNWLKGKLHAVGKWFYDLYDKVVGHSYIPDMVDEIGAQMARLDAVMVQPVVDATSRAAEAFRALQQSTKGLLDRLFPEQAALNTLKSEMATLEAAMKSGILTANQYAAALDRLQTEGLTDVPIGVLDTESLAPSGDDIFTRIGAALEEIPAKAQAANDALAYVAHGGINMLADGLTAVIMGTAKLGDVFKTVAQQIIADLIRIQIQKMLMQLVGGTMGIPLPSFGGARAAGGPVMSGKAYLVGERGPEMFMPGNSGQIIPNHALGVGGSTSLTQNFYGQVSRETAMQAGARARAGIASANRKGA